MNRLVPIAAAAALLAAPLPARAEYDSGLTCGMSGFRHPDTTLVSVVLYGGPWRTESPRPDVEVTIRCTVWWESSTGTQEFGTSVSTTAAGGVGVFAPQPASFPVSANATAALYLCTEITVYDPLVNPPHRHHYSDADYDPSNGAQCEKTEPDENDLVYVYSEPPRPDNTGARCTHVGHGVGPTYLPNPLPDVPAPPEEVCDL
ncbi:MAG TPA: hypothetical protein VNA20_14695 [Frankiaceae bacterium]|nr:hypothetical protein [Frankiaceae bacterium]